MAWLRNRELKELAVSAVTVHELRYGIEIMDEGKERRRLSEWPDYEIIGGQWRSQMLAVNDTIASVSGRQLATLELTGNNKVSVADALVAATARVYNLQIATLDRDFKLFGVATLPR